MYRHEVEILQTEFVVFLNWTEIPGLRFAEIIYSRRLTPQAQGQTTLEHASVVRGSVTALLVFDLPSSVDFGFVMHLLRSFDVQWFASQHQVGLGDGDGRYELVVKSSRMRNL